MLLYKFKASPGSRVALTNDKTGSNLPKGDWQAAGTVDVNAGDQPRIGARAEEILSEVARDGYSIWPRIE